MRSASQNKKGIFYIIARNNIDVFFRKIIIGFEITAKHHA